MYFALAHDNFHRVEESKKLLHMISLKDGPPIIHRNKISGIAMTRNPRSHARSKHIAPFHQRLVNRGDFGMSAIAMTKIKAITMTSYEILVISSGSWLI